ncbi:hypothetical protein QMZ92_25235 [Streptomyces sp. HNM0645]|uniref:hypothetical protein n=1 Tax=Streptomyces sp. HNM0645 TaxID=2782343 RepID=UPI0024B6FFA8|nr:hypothetical protein [Streptomyces sp. HNM0645]MDI9887585.1 hypothetical protein [Streptomyces sp. HNM0645]
MGRQGTGSRHGAGTGGRAGRTTGRATDRRGTTGRAEGMPAVPARARGGARRAGLRLVTAVALLALAGCGSDQAASVAPKGWGTLETPSVSVAHPPAFKEQGEAERSRFNAAAATLTEDGRAVGTITVQLGFTEADSAEEAAIGAEAGIALGSTPKGQKEITVAGPEGRREARRIDFEFTRGPDRVRGVLVAGLDTARKAYAVRVDAVKGRLGDDDLKKIVESVEVR